jgi:hypothetical protein
MTSGRSVTVSGAARRWEPHCLPVSEKVNNNALYVQSFYRMPCLQQYKPQTERHNIRSIKPLYHRPTISWFWIPWPIWGFLHKLSLDTKLPISTHSLSSPRQHVTGQFLEHFTNTDTAILTWWLMDKLVLLLLVARDEDDDVVDEVPPTGWPRDKPALVYSGWEEPNDLWTEDIKRNIQHWVIQCSQQFLFNNSQLELQNSHHTYIHNPLQRS